MTSAPPNRNAGPARRSSLWSTGWTRRFRSGGGYAGSLELKAWAEAGASDPRLARFPVPDSVLGPALAALVAHEVGHTLGLGHNLHASADVPVDSLRSPDFTCGRGLAPSVMDYTPFNYVAQPGDGACVVDRGVGPWDHRAIDGLYGRGGAVGPVPRVWMESEPYDSRATLHALGDDPLAATALGVANLRRLAEEVPRLAADPGAPSGSDLYDRLALTWQCLMTHVVALVASGGPSAPEVEGLGAEALVGGLFPEADGAIPVATTRAGRLAQRHLVERLVELRAPDPRIPSLVGQAADDGLPRIRGALEAHLTNAPSGKVASHYRELKRLIDP